MSVPSRRVRSSCRERSLSEVEQSGPALGAIHQLDPEVPSLTCITPRALGICKHTSCPVLNFSAMAMTASR
jgi:hypothetical protein